MGFFQYEKVYDPATMLQTDEPKLSSAHSQLTSTTSRIPTGLVCLHRKNLYLDLESELLLFWVAVNGFDDDPQALLSYSF